MAKFKKTEFDYTNLMVLSGGRYLLVGSVYGEETAMLRLVTEVVEEYGLTPVLNIRLAEKAFRFLAKKIRPDIDNSRVYSNTVVLYSPTMHLEAPTFE